MDITPDVLGKFDVVMFLGLYHLQDPWQARVAAAVCNELLIIETVVDDIHRWKPSMVYYPKDSLNNDDTNYWAPNVAAMKVCSQTLDSKREVVYPKKSWLRYSFPVRLYSTIRNDYRSSHSVKQSIKVECHSMHTDE